MNPNLRMYHMAPFRKYKTLISQLTLILGLLSADASLACGGDALATKGWSLNHLTYSDAGSLPFLSPGNDSRINLLYLMSDANHWTVEGQTSDVDYPAGMEIYSPALFSYSQIEAFFSNAPINAAQGCARSNSWKTSFLDEGEGSRCRSLASGAKAFTNAVENDQKLTPTERAALISAREGWALQCDSQQLKDVLVRDPLTGIQTFSASAKDFAN